MINDLVSDMLTRIRNASMVKHNIVSIPYSKLNSAILKVLKKEGYIQNFEINNTVKKNWTQKQLIASLKYKGWWVKKPFFSKITRISKPGRRIFSKYKDFDKKLSILKYHQGIAIISTSSGVMSHKKALALKKGGEILCYIG